MSDDGAPTSLTKRGCIRDLSNQESPPTNGGCDDVWKIEGGDDPIQNRGVLEGFEVLSGPEYPSNDSKAVMKCQIRRMNIRSRGRCPNNLMVCDAESHVGADSSQCLLRRQWSFVGKLLGKSFCSS